MKCPSIETRFRMTLSARDFANGCAIDFGLSTTLLNISGK